MRAVTLAGFNTNYIIRTMYLREWRAIVHNQVAARDTDEDVVSGPNPLLVVGDIGEEIRESPSREVLDSPKCGLCL